MLKSFLQDWRENGHDAWVVFVCLFKACDSAQHKVIEETLKIFGVPSNLIGWAMKLYANLEVEAKVGKHKSKFPHGCSMGKGDSLAPVLFF